MEWSGGCGEEKKCDIIAAINFLNIPTTNGSNEKKKNSSRVESITSFLLPKRKIFAILFFGGGVRVRGRERKRRGGGDGKKSI